MYEKNPNISVSAPLPLVVLENIAVRVGDRLILPETSWEIRRGCHWAVIGPNGAGKSSLVRALTGDAPVVRGSVVRHEDGAPAKIGYVSFELGRRLIAQDENADEARFFSDNLDTLTTVRQVIEPFCETPDTLDHCAGLLEITSLLDRPIRFLSTGEMRKVLIARAVASGPALLILDEPFDGLDIASRNRLKQTIHSLMQQDVQVILVTHRMDEILPGISHVLCVENCRVTAQGKREEILKEISPAKMEKTAVFHRDKKAVSKNEIFFPASVPLIDMRNITVRYGGTVILDRLDWTVREGENWAVTGPNGAGKTTLLRLVSGDNPQAYANDIHLFGRKKGSGESIWEIKQQIGLVSWELQTRYRKSITVREVVLSGFFDSVGLYRHASPEQRAVADKWMETLNIMDKSDRRFDRLSYGEQRMVLIARAVVKSPRLLVLDEPCQGLDRSNRNRVLELADYIGSESKTRLLYVTHHPDEIPPCIHRTLCFQKQEDGTCRAVSI